MCRLANINICIKKLDFSAKGRMSALLSDGREISVPISMFPDIKKLSIKQRGEWMVLDDQFFTFKNLSRIFSIQDLMRLK